MSIKKYFIVSDSNIVACIDYALMKVNKFDEKLHSLQKKYKADKPMVFNSIDRGLEFSNLWFKDYPIHLDTKNEFKISTEKHKQGYEARPRKTNKKFYDKFMEDMIGVDYKQLVKVLFGTDTSIRLELEFTVIDHKYIISCSKDLNVKCQEITGSEYQELIK